MIKVFLVDDHEVVRRGIADLLTADPDLTVIGEAASYAQAMARVPAFGPMSLSSTYGFPMATASSCAASYTRGCRVAMPYLDLVHR